MVTLSQKGILERSEQSKDYRQNRKLVYSVSLTRGKNEKTGYIISTGGVYKVKEVYLLLFIYSDLYILCIYLKYSN